MIVLFKLLVGHSLGDFALQNDFIANFKSRHAKFFTGETIWPYVLGCHSLIHGGFVFLATGRIELGIAETFAHALIDFGKGEKWFGFHTDQILHIACKVIWLMFLTHLPK